MTSPPRSTPPGETERTSNVLAGVLIAIGALVLVVGVGMYSVPAGVITLAVELIAAGVLAIDVDGRRGRREQGDRS